MSNKIFLIKTKKKFINDTELNKRTNKIKLTNTIETCLLHLRLGHIN